jgi:hypothetical protein
MESSRLERACAALKASCGVVDDATLLANLTEIQEVSLQILLAVGSLEYISCVLRKAIGILTALPIFANLFQCFPSDATASSAQGSVSELIELGTVSSLNTCLLRFLAPNGRDSIDIAVRAAWIITQLASSSMHGDALVVEGVVEPLISILAAADGPANLKGQVPSTFGNSFVQRTLPLIGCLILSATHLLMIGLLGAG